MRISELTAYQACIRLRKRIRHASFTRDENQSLIVRCRLDDGSIGWGEGLPRPYVTGESIESAFTQLSDTDWRRQLGGSLADLREAVGVCRELTLPGADSAARDCFGNAARCAVELAVLDAVARATNEPLARVTDLFPEAIAIRKVSPRARYSAAVTGMSAAGQLVQAFKFRLYGFQHCKVKVGFRAVDDVACLRRVRRVLGRRRDLRIDVNEAWTCANLEAQLEPLRPFALTALEQPVPHAEVDGLARLRGRIGVPLMLDESLCSLSDGRRAIERGTCDLFNIRLSKCGGFLRGLELAAMAHQAGLGYQLGCQVGETGILSAAGRHFATSVSDIRYLEGSYDRHLVRERLTEEDITFGPGGWAPALAGAGLGVRIDEAALQRVTVREEHWNLALC